MLSLRTILHPTDFSEAAMYAFAVARAVAKASGAELLVVHVAPYEHRPKRRHRRERIEAVRRLTTVDPEVRMRSLSLEGDPAGHIIGCAKELDCDLIIMGAPGRSGLKRLLLGSVAAAVRKDAPCPVMTVELPKRADWELPDFADKESLANGLHSGPLFRDRCAADGRT